MVAWEAGDLEAVWDGFVVIAGMGASLARA
jgi:hypothetical protein